MEAARAHASQRAATLEEQVRPPVSLKVDSAVETLPSNPFPSHTLAQIDSKSFSKLLADVKSNAEETRQRAALARAQLADLRRRVQGGRTALEQRRTLLLRALGQVCGTGVVILVFHNSCQLTPVVDTPAVCPCS